MVCERRLAVVFLDNPGITSICRSENIFLPEQLLILFQLVERVRNRRNDFDVQLLTHFGDVLVADS